MKEPPLMLITPGGAVMPLIDLRDYFAAHAPTETPYGWKFDEPEPKDPENGYGDEYIKYITSLADWNMRRSVAWAYAYADAMIKQRDKELSA
jgi:hypothetical protein